jgi:hypothetical protein
MANPDPAGALSGLLLRGLFIWCEGMAQYSSELIELTVSVFENRIGRDISKEEARQAVENISGFFQVLQEWVEAEEKEKGIGSLVEKLTHAESWIRN